MTELRIKIPISASTPRIATNPSGAPLGSKAMTTPIKASGATANTRNSRWKLCSCIIRIVAMMKSISGTTASIGAWLFALSSTEPPIATEYPAGSPFANSVTFGAS